MFQRQCWTQSKLVAKYRQLLASTALSLFVAIVIIHNSSEIMNGNDDEINTTFLFLIRILDDYLTEEIYVS